MVLALLLLDLDTGEADGDIPSESAAVCTLGYRALHAHRD